MFECCVLFYESHVSFGSWPPVKGLLVFGIRNCIRNRGEISSRHESGREHLEWVGIYCCRNVDPFVHSLRMPKLNWNFFDEYKSTANCQIQFNFSKPNLKSNEQRVHNIYFTGASRTISINRQLITISTALLRMPPLLKSKCAPQSHSRNWNSILLLRALFTCLRASGHWDSISISLRSAHHSNINNEKCKL